MICLILQEPMKSRAPQLHLEYRFYRTLGNAGESDYVQVNHHLSGPCSHMSYHTQIPNIHYIFLLLFLQFCTSCSWNSHCDNMCHYVKC